MSKLACAQTRTSKIANWTIVRHGGEFQNLCVFRKSLLLKLEFRKTWGIMQMTVGIDVFFSNGVEKQICPKPELRPAKLYLQSSCLCVGNPHVEFCKSSFRSCYPAQYLHNRAWKWHPPPPRTHTHTHTPAGEPWLEQLRAASDRCSECSH